jgi:DNA-binding beta-propeller fold protein YncE
LRLTRLLVTLLVLNGSAHPAAQEVHRYLYVSLPGSDDAGPDRSLRIVVFDIARAHRFVRRIALWPASGGDDPETVRGTAASAATGRLYLSTTRRLAAIDVNTDRIVWERRYEGRGCDRIAVSPDGRTIYAPAFGSPKWYVVDAATGDVRATIDVMGWPRATVYSRDGRRAYLSAWEASTLMLADTSTSRILRTVGPFSGFLCPFAVNARDTLVFANVDGLVGFEVADLQTGLILDSVAVEGYDKDAAAQYECPSHGIAFTHDQRQLWVADGVRNRLHVYDATVYPPAPVGKIELSAQPRWITVSGDDRYAYPSTGDVIDVALRRIVGSLEDPSSGRSISEQMVEVDLKH